MIIKGTNARLFVDGVEIQTNSLTGEVSPADALKAREVLESLSRTCNGAAHFFERGQEFCWCGEMENPDLTEWVSLAEMERIWNQN